MFYEIYHIRTAEQIALSIVFQHYGQITSCDDTVFHYWFLKEARFLLEAYYGRTSTVEEKYKNSAVVTKILELTDSVQDIDLLKTVIKLTKIRRSHNYSGLFRVFDHQSLIGKLLRDNGRHNN